MELLRKVAPKETSCGMMYRGRSWVKRTWPGTLLWTWLASQSKAKVVLPERPGAVKNVMINSITKCESDIICKKSSSQYMFEESLSYIHSFAFLPFAS